MHTVESDLLTFAVTPPSRWVMTNTVCGGDGERGARGKVSERESDKQQELDQLMRSVR